MSIWFLFWCLLSVGLFGFFGWTLVILYKQKKAWKAYAEKRKCRYKGGKWLESPEISGTVDEYTVTLFTGEHLFGDVRAARRLTAIEILLKEPLPLSGALASGDLVKLVQALELGQEYRPAYKGWDKNYIARTKEISGLKAYLKDQRLEKLISLMQEKNASVILIFQPGTTLLRFDTPYPLDTPRKIDELVKKIISVAHILELESGEAAHLKKDLVEAAAKTVSIEVNEDDLSASGLSLEEDENKQS